MTSASKQPKEKSAGQVPSESYPCDQKGIEQLFYRPKSNCHIDIVVVKPGGTKPLSCAQGENCVVLDGSS